ncbi:MAG: hypothetical protein DMG97_25940 [Acidobacteria bacterium]|nr:MAG: hypothetical protein DMG97_25940 [Acidobacteriota bacterium]PYV80185.1 MAG: hypothetical protein DMG96_01485 [Acidobacteriota bacterium]
MSVFSEKVLQNTFALRCLFCVNFNNLNFRFQISDFRFQISDWRLENEDCHMIVYSVRCQ